MVAKQLGEVVLRTPDVGKMAAFYRDVIQLEPYLMMGTMQFFKIAEGINGQAQAIGIFDLNEVSDVDDTAFGGHDARQTPLHHFAFIIDVKDYYTELNRIAALGYTIRTMEHPIKQSRAFYLYDPDGNTVEFVCYDPSIPASG